MSKTTSKPKSKSKKSIGVVGTYLKDGVAVPIMIRPMSKADRKIYDK